MDRRAAGAWAGLAGTALFVLTFLIEGWLRPGYSPLGQFVSELSLGPRGWVQITSFLVTGALLLFFAWSVAAAFPTGKASRWGPILLAIIGLGLFVSGPLVMDPADTPRELWTARGMAHQIMGAIVFALAPVTGFVFWRRFRSDPRWRSFAPWTLAASIVMVGAVLLLRVASPDSVAALAPYDGLLQRLLLLTLMGWLFTFAWKLRAYVATAK